MSPPPKRRSSDHHRNPEAPPPLNDPQKTDPTEEVQARIRRLLATSPPQKTDPTEGVQTLYKVVGKTVQHYQSFLSFLAFVKDRDEIADDVTFSKILHHALTEFPITQSALSQRLGYANSQIGRWMTGKAAPHVLVRQAVIDMLAGMIEGALENLTSETTLIARRLDNKGNFKRRTLA